MDKEEIDYKEIILKEERKSVSNVYVCPFCGRVNWGNSMYCGLCGAKLYLVRVGLRRPTGENVSWREYTYREGGKI